MDGEQKQVAHSLQFRLSLWLSLSVLVVATLGAAMAFFSAYQEAHESQDDNLRQVANLFDQNHLPSDSLSGLVERKSNDEDSRILVQLITTTQSNISVPPLNLKSSINTGMHTVILGTDKYRVWVKRLNATQKLAVAQSTEVRNEIALDDAQHALVPFVFLLPALLVLIQVLMKNMFRPIALLTREVNQRSEIELHPISPEDVPAEIRPFIIAINNLLERVSGSIEAQQNFISAAAHELRSPLTALLLQAERLESVAINQESQQRLIALKQGIERSRNLVEQLLKLAHAQSDSLGKAEFVSVQQVFRRVLEDLWPLAEQKKIDIGVVSQNDVLLNINEADLVVIMKNLIDNSIRYTPDAGRIDLSVSQLNHTVILEVEDSGIGIPENQRDLVFTPFYRILGSDQVGSGLGLAIVKTLAEQWKGHVRFSDSSKFESGTLARVEFPARNIAN